MEDYEVEGRTWEARIDGQVLKVQANSSGEVEFSCERDELTIDQARWLALRFSQAADYAEGEK